MSSVIGGYNYDIFISYRQKDNKYDGWVTAFVDNLKKELEATFKEEISVYFDINPHDGLLETHDVDASLKEKLKCLVFIPIISRTYCDPKSFAWEHEFKAFIEQASKDQYGLKIRLPGGNVANRVLPVQIHDLDSDDKMIVEGELGGFLRGIEFIYKSPGINRPLLPKEENPQDNLNRTNYRDQINKVANAIKEIITGLKNQDKEGKETSKGIDEIKPSGKKNQITKILAGVLIILVLIVAGYFIISKVLKPKEQLEKSIAVLPFKSLSDDPEKQYLADGIRDAILLHLSKIEDLRVMSRTSTEQYRIPGKTMTEIGRELNVEYLLEGSFQKSGDNVRLIVQLIKAIKDDHIWSNEYDRNWNDIFAVQSEVAQAIAREIHAVITPEEQQLIEKTPTTDLTAYDFYQRGREEYQKYWLDNDNLDALEKAELLYYKSLEYDSTFAQVYSGLAKVYWDKHNFKDYFLENYQDSAIILANKALSYDDQLPDAYYIRGKYYSETGNIKQAHKEFDRAIKLNPNDWMAYYGKGNLYSDDDCIKWIIDYQKAASLNRGPELSALLLEIGWAYYSAGYPEIAKQYYQDKLKLDGDSANYYAELARYERWLGNLNKAIEFGLKSYAIDSTNIVALLFLGGSYEFLGQYKESLKYLKKWIERSETQGDDWVKHDLHRVGYAYWINGFKEEAEYYFNEQINYCNKMINLSRLFAKTLYPYYDLAGIYALRGDKVKAYENLRIFNERKIEYLWSGILIKTDPLFNSIKNEPEFQQIVKDVEAKYQAEHERVRKWLEEQGML